MKPTDDDRYLVCACAALRWNGDKEWQQHSAIALQTEFALPVDRPQRRDNAKCRKHRSSWTNRKKEGYMHKPLIVAAVSEGGARFHGSVEKDVGKVIDAAVPNNYVGAGVAANTVHGGDGRVTSGMGITTQTTKQGTGTPVGGARRNGLMGQQRIFPAANDPSFRSVA